MKIVEKCEATGPLADYAARVKDGPVVITDHGQPVAALVSLENTDLETISVCTKEKFASLIERSRDAVRRDGTISAAELRRRAEPGDDRPRRDSTAGQPPQ